MKIEKKLKKSLKNLYSQYKKSLDEKGSGWLTDNYYIFERESQGILKFFSQPKSREMNVFLHCLFEKCSFLFSNGKMSESEIGKALGESEMSLLSFEFAPTVFKAVFIISAGENVFDEKKTEKCVKALRGIDETDFELLAEEYGEKEKMLLRDSVYKSMPPECKSAYRKRIFYLSNREKKSEKETVTELFKSKEHIGFRLFTKRKNRNIGYIFIEAFITLILSVFISLILGKPFLSFLFLFPVGQIVGSVALRAEMRKNPPKPVLRLDSEKIPDCAKTLVTVSSLLPCAKDCEKTEKHLTELYASNRDENVFFCLLVDKKEFSSAEKPDDGANIAALKRVIQRLNNKYGNRFFLLIRPREYSKTSGCFTGKNRKMGAIGSLVKLICSGENDFETVVGDISLIGDMSYIFALDSDTMPDFLATKKLVMTALHPLNKAVIDEKSKKVKRGYGIFSVQALNSLMDESGTLFSLLMSGSGGSIAYDNLCCDRFSDVFSSGIFAGKGLIDVAAYNKILLSRFRDEKILSHDIIEGELLNTLFVSDISVADSFPKSESSFLSRLHRWIRGDWQNIPFLTKHPSVFLKKEVNPLPFISRFKLFENLRRSLNEVFSLLLILSSVFFDGKTAAVMISVSLLSLTADEILSFFRSLVSGGLAMLSRLYYSAAIPDSLNKLTVSFIKIITLPRNAFKSLNAIVLALTRQFITKKKVLEWVTAADSEKSSSLFSVVVNNFSCILCAAFLMIFHTPYTVLCSLLFLLNIPFEYCSQKRIKKEDSSLDSLTKERLVSHAAAQWKYYEKYADEKYNYLPADNVQFSPVFRVAERTSPTNIGLFLACVTAARQFGFISEEEMLFKLEKAVSSIEKLEKWHGNLLNWYDIKTLRPLEPRFVSTVDSGNFLCSLTAVKQALKENKNATDLYGRIEKIISETDLEPLYNKKRHLFHIGFDLSENRLSSSYYDLLMSEARMTSYFAVSRRIVEKKHWGALSRSLRRAGRYSGPVSWSGTMFEYFMPDIFLPAKKNSFSYEGLRFCLYCQQLYSKGKHIPWGISESAFYAFDNDYNYQYKAHGVGRLSLARGSSADTVISPYSTYLALPFSPKKAAVNIKKLEKLHLLGPYALYEAADFTKSRAENREYRIVKSYMAHHIGMSMLSILNATDNFYMQRLFMSDIDMAAGKNLLEEKIPTFTPVLKKYKKSPPSEQYERRERFIKGNSSFSVLNPKAQAYSNGEWTLNVCENGTTKSTFGDKCIFIHSDDFLFNPAGVTALVKSNKEIMYFSPYMNTERAENYSCVFRENEAVIGFNDGKIRLTQRLSVHKFLPCERRLFTVQNLSKRKLEGELLIYLEPCLAGAESHGGHPAFSKLFVTENYDEKEKILSFARRDKNEDEQVSLSLAFPKSERFMYTCNRESVLKRPDGIFSLGKDGVDFSKKTGTPDCCALFSVKINLAPREKKTVPLIISASKTQKGSREIILEGRRKNIFASFESAPSILDNSSQSGVLSKEILPNLIYRPALREEQKNAIYKNERAVDALWSLGISGDKPIILFVIKSEEDIPLLKRLIKIHSAFQNAFIKNDLAVVFNSVTKPSVDKALKDGSFSMNGIFTVDADKTDAETLNSLTAFCSYYAKNDLSAKQKEEKFEMIKIRGGSKADGENAVSENGFMINRSPVLPWCFVYSNDCLGTLISDKALGFTFAFNSYLNKLTKWTNDTRTDLNSEIILIKSGEKYFNPIVNSNVVFETEKAVYTSVCDGIEITVTINVEKRKMQKNITMKMRNASGRRKAVSAVFSVEPVLYFNDGSQRLLHFEKGKNEITVSNPLNRDFKGKMRLSADFDADAVVFDKTALFEGKWGNCFPLPCRNPVASLGKTFALEKDEEKSFNFSLGFICDFPPEFHECENRITINSPDKNLNSLVNVFLPVQILRGRLQSRTGFYQCSGAYGFRDQLQDALSLVLTEPERLKEQIILCAKAQFEEGDVLHWFHVLPDGVLKGVRTKYADDRLWLPLAVSEYIFVTGDRDFLNAEIPFLRCPKLNENESERYVELYPSDESGSIFDHCVRAIEKSLVYGKNGLPKIFGGDWNDGFNGIGRNGNGESVWLGQFLIIALERFSGLCDEERKSKYKTEAEKIRKSIDENAWNGDWYIRAFLDDGTPIGDGKNECKIDSLSQSFAVFCKMPDKERIKSSLENAEKYLFDADNGLIKLFSDGFVSDRRAGYISAYPVGLRENAGQYTHAAVWLAASFIKNGQVDRGYEMLGVLNPLNKYENARTAEKYMTEPYFLAGDVYSRKGVEGRGGWSLYTGSAGWYYKTVIETVFGIKKISNTVFIKPNFPSDWKNCSMTVELNNVKYEIEYVRSDKNVLIIDGEEKPYLTLDGKKHKIIVNFCGK
ncbi:MAG: hypothetical protein K5755_06130 [Clostridiales bacterium]|nr:hypothetical protein [Clostridiales bacterium]